MVPFSTPQNCINGEGKLICRLEWLSCQTLFHVDYVKKGKPGNQLKQKTNRWNKKHTAKIRESKQTESRKNSAKLMVNNQNCDESEESGCLGTLE
jgi:hypothetical protein